MDIHKIAEATSAMAPAITNTINMSSRIAIAKLKLKTFAASFLSQGELLLTRKTTRAGTHPSINILK